MLNTVYKSFGRWVAIGGCAFLLAACAGQTTPAPQPTVAVQAPVVAPVVVSVVPTVPTVVAAVTQKPILTATAVPTVMPTAAPTVRPTVATRLTPTSTPAAAMQHDGAMTGQTAPLIEVDPVVMVMSNQAYIPKVVIHEKGWLVLHDGKGGQIGRIMGATALKAGENSDIIVKVDTPSTEMVAMLHVDKGVVGKFESDKDVPLLYNGKTVTARFGVMIH